MVAASIDLEHVRRSRRLLTILVDRFGVAHFLDRSSVNMRACDDAIALACAWIERRTDRPVSEDVEAIMRRELQRVLKTRIASGAALSR